MHIPRPGSGNSGLSMLLGHSDAKGSGRLLDLPLGSVVRNEAQPRTTFDPDAIAALATSIASQGVIQPIAVRDIGEGRFEIIAGERRWLAARQAGLRTVPAVVHDVDARDSLVLALAENLVRENLNALETARAYAHLLDEFELTIADLARAIGKSRPAVSNTLRLLELPDDVIALIEEGRLSEGHGRALLQVEDRILQRRLARQAVDASLSVRALEAAVREFIANAGEKSRSTPTKWNAQATPELELKVERIAEQLLGVRAKVKVGERGGKLEFHTRDARGLAELVDRLEAALQTA